MQGGILPLGRAFQRGPQAGREVDDKAGDLRGAQATGRLRPALNPDAVMQTAWTRLTELKRQVQTDPARFTPLAGDPSGK